MHKLKKTLFLLTALSLLATIDLYGQTTLSKVFENSMYEGVVGYSIQKAGDGGYIIAGSNDLEKGLVIKMDSNAVIIWDKAYSVSNCELSLNSIVKTNDGFLVAGHILISPDDAMRIFYMKIDSLGSILWSNAVNNSFYDASCWKIEPVADGGFILVCNSDYYGGPSLLLKITSDGVCQWDSEYIDVMFSLANIKSTPDGGYFVIGTLYGFGSGIYKTVLIKTDSIGTLIWAKLLNSPEITGMIGVDIMVQSNEYRVLLATEHSLILTKIDLNGNPYWAKSYSCDLNPELYFTLPATNCLELDDQGFAYMGKGYYNGELIRVDSNGFLVFHQSIGFIAQDATATEQGGFMCMGKGPLLGVNKDNTSLAQTGISKSDSEGNLNDCSSNIWTDMDTLLITTSSYNLWSGVEGLSSQTISVNTDEFEIQTKTGCVDFYEEIRVHDNTENLSVLPNPNDGNFVVTTNGKATITQLEVYDFTGRMVFSKTTTPTISAKVELPQAQSGIYLICVYTSKGLISTKMMINREKL